MPLEQAFHISCALIGIALVIADPPISRSSNVSGTPRPPIC